jgi:phosphatidate cytidylyltransferase
MSELAKRVAFAVVAAPTVVAIVWLGGPWLAALIAVLAGIGAWEFYRLAVGGGTRPLSGHGIVLSALVPLCVHARFLGLWVPDVTILMLVVLELLTVALLVRGADGRPLEVVGSTLLGVFYTGGMLSFAYALRYHAYAIDAATGTALVALPLVLTWATDIGGYVFGRMFGGAKLMPSVSPGKTRSGAIGGLLLAVVICYAYVQFVLKPYGQLALSVGGTLLFAAVLSASGQMGDLVESMLKRQAGVKDSSHLIPGHGGLLDRADSLLFTLPVGFALLGWLLLPAPR